MDNSPAKTIYFVRHGQSVDNILPVFQTHFAELTKLGRIQCEATAMYILKSGIHIDKTISSNLKRAVESAEIINSIIGGDLEFSDLLIERKSPSFIQGLDYSHEEASRLWSVWEENFYKNTPTQDAEISKDTVQRAVDFLKSIQEDSSNCFLVVTHGFFLRVIIAVVLLGEGLDGASLKKLQASLMTSNAAITTLTYTQDFKGDMAWRLLTYNATIPIEVEQNS